jgi:hypothetical protein
MTTAARRVGSPVLAVLSLCATAHAQPTTAREPRWTLGAVGSGATRANQRHLPDGQAGVQGSALLLRSDRITLRAEGRATQFPMSSPDPTLTWCSCDGRIVSALAAAGVSATIQLAQPRRVPYAIAALGGYGTLWSGGTDERGPRPLSGPYPKEASGVGPGGLVLGAGLGWRLGGGRTPLRLELRHESFTERGVGPAHFVTGGLTIGF